MPEYDDEDFFEQTVIGHGITAETYTPESKFADLDDKIKIRVGDVDWNENKQVEMPVEVFEQLIEWYEDTQ